MFIQEKTIIKVLNTYIGPRANIGFYLGWAYKSKERIARSSRKEFQEGPGFSYVGFWNPKGIQEASMGVTMVSRKSILRMDLVGNIIFMT